MRPTLLLATLLALPLAAAAGHVALDDPAGDVTVSPANPPWGPSFGLTCPRTDILGGAIDRTPDGLILSMKVQDATARCAGDPAWYDYRAGYWLADASGPSGGWATTRVSPDNSWSEACVYLGSGWWCGSGPVGITDNTISWNVPGDMDVHDVYFSADAACVTGGPSVCLNSDNVATFLDRMPDAGVVQPPP